VTFKCNLKNN